MARSRPQSVSVRLPFRDQQTLTVNDDETGIIPADCPGADALRVSYSEHPSTSKTQPFMTTERVEVVSLSLSTETARIRPTDSPTTEPEPVSFDELAPLTATDKRAERRKANGTFRAGPPKYYIEELKRREEILEACPIDVYCSSVNPAWGWPDKLMSYYEARPGVTDSCETLIIDSGYNRWGSPEDVLAAAAKTDADYVIATDVTSFEDPENRAHNDAMPSPADDGISDWFEAALEGIRRFMIRARELSIEDRVILPIQPPYDEFLDACKARGWLSDVEYVSVGGLLGIDDVEDRIDALHRIRDRLGSDYKIHALAPGRNPEMMIELRENPGLIDSLDNSTPERAPGNDKIPDASGKQTNHFFPRGTHASTLRGRAAALIALETAQMLSPLCNADETFEVLQDDDQPNDDDDGVQASISDWANDETEDTESTSPNPVAVE